MNNIHRGGAAFALACAFGLAALTAASPAEAAARDEIGLDSWNFQYGRDFASGPDDTQWQAVTLPNIWYMHTLVDTSVANIVQNPGFETGLSPWAGNPAALPCTADTGVKHGGAASLKVSGRTAVWHGPVQDVKEMLLAKGQGTYDTSAWVQFASGTDTIHLNLHYVDDTGTHYTTFAQGPAGSDQFTEVTGEANVAWSGTLSSAQLEVNTGDASKLLDFYLDDVSIVKVVPTDNLVKNADIENDVNHWQGNPAALALTADTAVKHGGAASLKVSGRSLSWHGPVQDVTAAVLAKGQGDYNASGWFCFASGTGTVQLQLRCNYYTVDTSGNKTYGAKSIPLASGAAGSDGFAEVSGKVNVTWPGTLTGAQLQAVTTGTANASADFYMDDVLLALSADDQTAPVSTVSLDGAQQNGWFAAAPTVTLNASDDLTGVARTEYRWGDDGVWTAYTGPFTPTQEGANDLQYRSTDRAGNAEAARHQSIRLDTSAPTGVAIAFSPDPFKTVAHFLTFGLFFGDTVTASLTASDSASGVDRYEYQMVADGGAFDAGGVWETGGSLAVAPDFKGTVYARAVDKAGNTSGYAARSLVVDKTAPSIRTGSASIHTSDPDASLSVTVTDNGAGVGSVSCQIGGGAAQTVDLTTDAYSGPAGSYPFSIPLPFGSYDVVLSAQDNAGNRADSVTVQVEKTAPPTVDGVAVSPASASVRSGETARFTAVVSGRPGPAQTVVWSVAGNRSADTAIDASGLLTVAADETAASLTVKAVSTADNAKSGTAVVTVEPAAPASSGGPQSSNPQGGDSQSGSSQGSSSQGGSAANPDTAGRSPVLPAALLASTAAAAAFAWLWRGRRKKTR